MSQNEPAVFGLGHLETSIAIDRGDAGCQGGGSGGQRGNSHLDALGARCRLHTRGLTSGSLTQEAGVWERRLDWTRGCDGFRDVGAPGTRGTSKGYRRTETRSSGWPTRLPAPASQEPGWWPSQGARRGRPAGGEGNPADDEVWEAARTHLTKNNKAEPEETQRGVWTGVGAQRRTAPGRTHTDRPLQRTDH